MTDDRPGQGENQVAGDSALSGPGQANRSVEIRGVKPWLVHQLCRDLATGEKKRSQLAREHGVAASTITEFAKRHKARIEEIKANLDDEFAGLWSAQKINRLNAYQDEYERIRANPHHEWVKAKATLLHSIAEELGQLPSRGVTVTGQVTHIIEGIEIEDLK